MNILHYTPPPTFINQAAKTAVDASQHTLTDFSEDTARTGHINDMRYILATHAPQMTHFSQEITALDQALAQQAPPADILAKVNALQDAIKAVKPTFGTPFQGTASWYGGFFHGRTTANGETYNMHDMTAAHKTLPFDTVLQVTNQSNGRSVLVRINDRGPYIGKRSIDLSRGAAEKLGAFDQGVINYQAAILTNGEALMQQQYADDHVQGSLSAFARQIQHVSTQHAFIRQMQEATAFSPQFSTIIDSSR